MLVLEFPACIALQTEGLSTVVLLSNSFLSLCHILLSLEAATFAVLAVEPRCESRVAAETVKVATGHFRDKSRRELRIIGLIDSTIPSYGIFLLWTPMERCLG